MSASTPNGTPSSRTASPATATIAGPAVEVTGLRKTYPGGVEAVKGIDFPGPRARSSACSGPNGAGKSTTIGMLTTTIAPTGGPLAWRGTTLLRSRCWPGAPPASSSRRRWWIEV